MVSTRSRNQVAGRKRFNPATHAVEATACTPTRPLAATHSAPRRRAPRRTTSERTNWEHIVAFTRDPDYATVAEPVVQAYTFIEIKQYFWKDFIPRHPELIDKFREQQREQDSLLVLYKWLLRFPVQTDTLEEVGKALVNDVLFDIDTTSDGERWGGTYPNWMEASRRRILQGCLCHICLQRSYGTCVVPRL